MRSTGIIRGVDKMGRVVIPKEIRTMLNIENEVDSFEIFVDGDKIILKKYCPKCIFCGDLAQSLAYEGYEVCLNCVDKLNALKEKAI